MNVDIEHSCLESVEWFEYKFGRAEFNRFRQQQIERMTIDNAYEGDIESNSENETSEKQKSSRTRCKRRHLKFRRSKPSELHFKSI